MNWCSPGDVAETILHEVLCAFEECQRPEISTAYVGIGVVPADDCCGTLVVSPERVARADPWPSENPDPDCAWWLATRFSVTLFRCIPGPGPTGRPPAAAELSRVFQSILDDGAVVWNTVQDRLPDSWVTADLVQEFAGPEGSCVAVITSITIGAQTSNWCICEPRP